MKDEIKEISQNSDFFHRFLRIFPEKPQLKNDLLDYITTLQEENENLKARIDKAIEYGKNCLENIKDQDQYMCESIDIVSLLQMIHQNYLDMLQGDDK